MPSVKARRHQAFSSSCDFQRQVITGINGVANSSPYPKVYKPQLKIPSLSWDGLFLQMF